MSLKRGISLGNEASTSFLPKELHQLFSFFFLPPLVEEGVSFLRTSRNGKKNKSEKEKNLPVKPSFREAVCKRSPVSRGRRKEWHAQSREIRCWRRGLIVVTLRDRPWVVGLCRSQYRFRGTPQIPLRKHHITRSHRDRKPNRTIRERSVFSLSRVRLISEARRNCVAPGRRSSTHGQMHFREPCTFASSSCLTDLAACY